MKKYESAIKVKNEKTYKIQYNIGHAKYAVSFHDGERIYSDGSKFYDIKIFKNKPALENFIKDLTKQGYEEEGLQG